MIGGLVDSAEAALGGAPISLMPVHAVSSRRYSLEKYEDVAMTLAQISRVH